MPKSYRREPKAQITILNEKRFYWEMLSKYLDNVRVNWNRDKEMWFIEFGNHVLHLGKEIHPKKRAEYAVRHHLNIVKEFLK